jgi:hypothetical protein
MKVNEDNDYSMLVRPSELKGYVLVRSDLFESLITKNLKLLTEQSKKVKCSSYCLRVGAANLLRTWKLITLASKK